MEGAGGGDTEREREGEREGEREREMALLVMCLSCHILHGIIEGIQNFPLISFCKNVLIRYVVKAPSLFHYYLLQAPTPGDNSTRTIIETPKYIQVVIYDHITRRKT